MHLSLKNMVLPHVKMKNVKNFAAIENTKKLSET